jgi:replicative DNA helicase
MFEISDARIRKGFIRVRDLINPAIKKVEKLYEEKSLSPGADCLVDLDHLNKGFQEGVLVILAGRPRWEPPRPQHGFPWPSATAVGWGSSAWK